ncbi:hypothetical protein H9P43_008110 [Blastocladiella emersonii ATCC 22665]|nr:hypothetical protein H9P43_008110 [Blastocladiella emersonii ATCC 22665]
MYADVMLFLGSALSSPISALSPDRNASGRAPLCLEPRLAQAALFHATDMALNRFLSHSGFSGSSPLDRIMDTGFLVTQWSEQVSYAQDDLDAPAAVAGFLNTTDGIAAAKADWAAQYGVGRYLGLCPDSGSVCTYWTQIIASGLQPQCTAGASTGGNATATTKTGSSTPTSTPPPKTGAGGGGLSGGVIAGIVIGSVAAVLLIATAITLFVVRERGGLKIQRVRLAVQTKLAGGRATPAMAKADAKVSGKIHPGPQAPPIASEPLSPSSPSAQMSVPAS